MGTGSIHESYAAVLISRSCTGVAVGFCMPAAQIYVSIFRLRQRYTYRVLQTIQMKLILLWVWAEQAVLGRAKTALKFKYEI